MRFFRSFLVVVSMILISSSPALACKIQVVFPDHLNAEYAGEYYVVSVLEKTDDQFLIRIEQAFGGRHAPGSEIKLRLRASEEAHAICANIPHIGRTYLVRATLQFDGIEISRFNWMNIPNTDAKFAGYVADLVAAKTGQQHVPVDASRRH